MSSNDRERNSSILSGDAVMDRLLRDAMARQIDDADGVESPECLDVETLAAWCEGSLDRSAKARAETHAAGGARCQAMLAAMARTESVVPAPRGQAAPSSLRKWVMMLGPAVAAAAAVVLWFAVEPAKREAVVSEQVKQ